MTESKVIELKDSMEGEIRKQQDLVNIYRAKLLKRENENRNILVQLSQLKEWKSKYQGLKQNINLEYNINEQQVITLTSENTKYQELI